MDGRGGCDKGTWSFQHGCGARNTPTEATVDPRRYRTACDALDAALRCLDAEIADEVEAEVAAIRARLADDVARAGPRLSTTVTTGGRVGGV